MGDLHLVLPALNMSILDAVILIIVQQISLMKFSLTMVDDLSTCGIALGGEGHSKTFLLFEFCCEFVEFHA